MSLYSLTWSSRGTGGVQEPRHGTFEITDDSGGVGGESLKTSLEQLHINEANLYIPTFSLQNDATKTDLYSTSFVCSLHFV